MVKSLATSTKNNTILFCFYLYNGKKRDRKVDEEWPNYLKLPSNKNDGNGEKFKTRSNAVGKAGAKHYAHCCGPQNVTVMKHVTNIEMQQLQLFKFMLSCIIRPFTLTIC